MTASQWIDLGAKLVEVLVLPIIAMLVSKYVRNARIRDALSIVNEQALLAVQRLNRARRALKDPSKPGSWTETEATALREEAVREIRRALGDSLSLLVEHYRSSAKVDIVLGRAVDAHAESTRSEPAGAPVAPVSSPDAHAPTLPPPPPSEAPESAAAEPSGDDAA